MDCYVPFLLHPAPSFGNQHPLQGTEGGMSPSSSLWLGSDEIFHMPPPDAQIYSPAFSALLCISGSSLAPGDHWQKIEGRRRIKFVHFLPIHCRGCVPLGFTIEHSRSNSVDGISNQLQGSTNCPCGSHPAHCVFVCNLGAKVVFFIFLIVEKIEKKSNIWWCIKTVWNSNHCWCK